MGHLPPNNWQESAVEAFAAVKSRWGDPPTVERHPLSGIAVWAFALSAAAVAAAYLAALLASGEHRRVSYGGELAALLVLIRVIAIPAGLLCAYAALFHCRLTGPRSGRGLAWAAVALSYASLLWHAPVLAVIMASLLRQLPVLAWMIPLFRYTPLMVFCVALAHVPVFAAESSFAKYAVVSLAIGGMFFSLLFPALWRSIDQARRSRCAQQLKETGFQLQEQVNLGFKPDLSSLIGQPREPPAQSPLPPEIRQAFEQAESPVAKRNWLPAD